MSNELGSGEIDLADDAVGGEGEIARRCEIVEVSVILQRHFQLIPGLTQFGVLQFQLNLVNLLGC